MYAKIKDSQLVQYPYGFGELQADNPHTNFNGAEVYAAFQGTEANLAGATLEQVVTQEHPQYDSKTQRVSLLNTPVLESGQWLLKWTIGPKTAEELAQQDAAQAAAIRSERNTKLGATDWTQGKDIPDNVSSTWAAYRQALRDVPAQAGFPWEVTWPTQPE
jgi:hypothetical protein